jgi:hypothetical protein
MVRSLVCHPCRCLRRSSSSQTAVARDYVDQGHGASRGGVPAHHGFLWVVGSGEDVAAVAEPTALLHPRARPSPAPSTMGAWFVADPATNLLSWTEVVPVGVEDVEVEVGLKAADEASPPTAARGVSDLLDSGRAGAGAAVSAAAVEGVDDHGDASGTGGEELVRRRVGAGGRGLGVSSASSRRPAKSGAVALTTLRRLYPLQAATGAAEATDGALVTRHGSGTSASASASDPPPPFAFVLEGGGGARATSPPWRLVVQAPSSEDLTRWLQVLRVQVAALSPPLLTPQGALFRAAVGDDPTTLQALLGLGAPGGETVLYVVVAVVVVVVVAAAVVVAVAVVVVGILIASFGDCVVGSRGRDLRQVCGGRLGVVCQRAVDSD